MTAHVDPDVIAAASRLDPAPPLAPVERDPVHEALRVFCALDAFAWPDSQWLSRVDPQLTPPACECSIIPFPMTRGFQLVEHDEPGTVRAMVCLVAGLDAETPIGLAAECLDRSDDVYRYPDDLPCLGLDQLDNPASYFAGAALPVHRTVKGWLLAGCVGIVPLDHDALWHTLYDLPLRRDGGCYLLLVEDVAHGKELRDDMLSPLPPHVQLRVRPPGVS